MFTKNTKKNIHLQTDCFVVSRIFSVTRCVRRFKLGLKPAQIYVRLSIIPLSPQLTYVSSGIIRHYVVAFVCLHFALPDTRKLNSYKELCITRVAADNSFVRVLNTPIGSVYIIECDQMSFIFQYRRPYSLRTYSISVAALRFHILNLSSKTDWTSYYEIFNLLVF